MPNFYGAVPPTAPGSTVMSTSAALHVPDLVLNDGSSIQSNRYHPYPPRPLPLSSNPFLPSPFNSHNLATTDSNSIVSRSSSYSSLAPSDSVSVTGSHTRQKGKKGNSSCMGAAQIVPWARDRKKRW